MRKFCDFLQMHPHLVTLVSTIAAGPAIFAVTLLRTIPSLSRLTIDGTALRSEHPSYMTYHQRFGTRVHTLHLYRLHLPSCQEFCRILLAFTGLRKLVCGQLWFDGSEAALPNRQREFAKKRLVNALHLETLEVSYRGQGACL